MRLSPCGEAERCCCTPGGRGLVQRRRRQVWYHGWWDGHGWWGRPQALSLQQLLCPLVAHLLCNAPASWKHNSSASCHLGIIQNPGEATRAQLSASWPQAGCWGQRDCWARADWVHAGPCMLSPAQMSALGAPADRPCEYPILRCFVPTAEHPRSPHCPNEVSFLLQELQR